MSLEVLSLCRPVSTRWGKEARRILHIGTGKMGSLAEEWGQCVDGRGPPLEPAQIYCGYVDVVEPVGDERGRWPKTIGYGAISYPHSGTFIHR